MNKKMKYLLAIAVVAASSWGGWAQGVDPYLDDAYLSPKEIEQRQAKELAEAKARAQARYQARLEQERLYQAARQAELEAYKKRIRDRELDAYNGQLSAEDSLELLALEAKEQSQMKASARRGEGQDARTIEIYGPYSQRLARFHSDAPVVIHNPDQVYINEGSPYGDTEVYINYYGGYDRWGRSFYPWYDDYYYYGYPRYGAYYGYRYDPWWPRYSYYDPWYYDRYRYGYYGYYGGFYGGFGSWGYGHYGYHWGVDPWYYYYGGGYSRHRYREYPSTHRSTSIRGGSSSYRRSERTTAYGAFQSARSSVEAGDRGYYGNRDRSVHGSTSSGTSYRGTARSSYSGYGSGSTRQQRTEASSYDSNSRNSSRSSSSSYGGSSSSRSSSSSYGGGSSSSGSSRSSGGGGSLRGRR